MGAALGTPEAAHPLVTMSTIDFSLMDDHQLRRWVEANPGRVDDKDKDGHTPLYRAVTIDNQDCLHYTPLQLVEWLTDKRFADVDAKSVRGETPLHATRSLEILNALLDRGADPNSQKDDDSTPLMDQAVTAAGKPACPSRYQCAKL